MYSSEENILLIWDKVYFDTDVVLNTLFNEITTQNWNKL